MEHTAGKQHIECEVAKCAYHGSNNCCELNRIMVRSCNCTSGHESETLCGSFREK